MRSRDGDEFVRTSHDLPVEVRVVQCVLGAEDRIAVLAQPGELGGEADGGRPVIGIHELAQRVDFSLHGACR